MTKHLTTIFFCLWNDDYVPVVDIDCLFAGTGGGMLETAWTWCRLDEYTSQILWGGCVLHFLGGSKPFGTMLPNWSSMILKPFLVVWFQIDLNCMHINSRAIAEVAMLSGLQHQVHHKLFGAWEASEFRMRFIIFGVCTKGFSITCFYFSFTYYRSRHHINICRLLSGEAYWWSCWEINR